MEKTHSEEIKARLMETNEEFLHLAHLHSEYVRQLEALEARPYLTSQEQVEEIRLKKLKLRAKDQMQELMNRYRAQQQAV
jgi:uncharacterized protein YdcH (DUF465 family)